MYTLYLPVRQGTVVWYKHWKSRSIIKPYVRVGKCLLGRWNIMPALCNAYLAGTYFDRYDAFGCNAIHHIHVQMCHVDNNA